MTLSPAERAAIDERSARKIQHVIAAQLNLILAYHGAGTAEAAKVAQKQEDLFYLSHHARQCMETARECATTAPDLALGAANNCHAALLEVAQIAKETTAQLDAILNSQRQAIILALEESAKANPR